MRNLMAGYLRRSAATITVIGFASIDHDETSCDTDGHHRQGDKGATDYRGCKCEQKQYDSESAVGELETGKADPRNDEGKKDPGQRAVKRRLGIREGYECAGFVGFDT